MKLLDLDIAEMEGVTKRWESDMASDSKLAKIVRPLIILYLTLAMTVYIVLESAGVISIKSSWISLYETIMVATYVSYFGGRSIEKYAKIRK
jgi:D-alanyl-lipoteichoic acid acyltransferase DltB (MBOAT superfamily)